MTRRELLNEILSCFGNYSDSIYPIKEESEKDLDEKLKDIIAKKDSVVKSLTKLILTMDVDDMIEKTPDGYIAEEDVESCICIKVNSLQEKEKLMDFLTTELIPIANDQQDRIKMF